MHFTFTLLAICVTRTLADFLGPTFPPPRDLNSDKSLVSASWANLTSTFDAALKKNNTSFFGVAKVTFSAGLFSIHDPAAAAKLQYHYTSPEIAHGTHGTNSVDGDSIYRMASVTKLFTVFAAMREFTDQDWDRPLTHVVPGLADLGGETNDDDPVYRIEWDKITPRALAAQIGGVPRDGLPVVNDLLYAYEAALAVGQSALDPVTTYGFPPVDTTNLGPCWKLQTPFCAPDSFIDVVNPQPPTFLPWTNPAYADDGSMLLGLAISNITGKSMATVYRESVFEPLGMTSSSSSPPTGDAELARSVIPGDLAIFAMDGGVTIPSGGLLSTINDLAKFGVGILNSTLLPADQTRKWMKPITHTASLSYSVGAPWEIIRYIHPSTGKVSDLYTKLGDSGPFGGCLVLIPDYNAGFSFLSANSNETLRSAASTIVLDYITDAILPALEAQAALEAARNLVGTYVSTDPNLNSSVTISLDESTVDGAPSSGLSISTWISNGTDVLASPLFGGVKPRLLPSIPNSNHQGAGKLAFQVSANPQTYNYTAASNAGMGPFMAQYATNSVWLGVDGTHYGGYGVNLFVIDVDEAGKATAVSPVVTRAKLRRRA